MTFQRSKKLLNLSMKKNILRKHNFVVEITFKGQVTVLEVEVKISEVSEFSILPYTLKSKTGNSRKVFFVSNFGRSYNLDAKTTKN